MTNVAMDPWILVVAGFVAGLFGALLGLGGGWLMVPAMTAAGLSAVASVGSSLAAMVVTTTVSTWKYHRQGRLNVPLGLASGLPAVLGVQLGKTALGALARLGVADVAVGGFYVALLAALGISMMRERKRRPGTLRRPRLPQVGPRIAVHGAGPVFLYQIAALGVLAGTLSGILGIGGGVVVVPILTGVFGLPVLTAVATSLVSVLVSASYGSLTFALAGDWNPAVAGWLALGAVFGGLLGTSLAPSAPERVLRRMFAALTVTTASSIALRLAGASRASATLLFGGAAVIGLASLAVLWLAFRDRRRAEAGRPS